LKQFQLQGTSTYLVGTGHSRILIDTGEGVPVWLENLVRVLQDEDIIISHVLLTHWHRDHTGGVAPLLARFPELQAYIYKNNPDKGQQPIANGQIFSVEGATLRALFTPGHAIDHMCFILEEENALFTGDNVLGHGFTVVENLGVFMTSLESMNRRCCRKGFPAHGAVIADLPSKINVCIRRYIRRENQVLNLLKESIAKATKSMQERRYSDNSRMKGSLTTLEMVRQIYGEDISEEMSVMALQPAINETLRKLEEDGKVQSRLELGKPFGTPSTCWYLL